MPKPSPDADPARNPGADPARNPGTGSVYSTGSGVPGPAGGFEPSAAAGSPPGSASAAGTPTAADYYAVNRGGGLFSEAISQRIGARIAVFAHRHGLAPSVLTAFNLGLGCLVSFVVIATAGTVAEDEGWAWQWGVGLLALAGWQLAYAFDCADGQLARVTGQASAAGARLDVLCDVAVQIGLVSALAAAAMAQVPETPAWLLAAFAGTWMVNLVTSVMQSGDKASSMVTSRSLPVRLIKLVRDYGALIALSGLVLTVAPQWTIWYVGLFTLVNAAFLAASVIFSGRAALRG